MAPARRFGPLLVAAVSLFACQGQDLVAGGDEPLAAESASRVTSLPAAGSPSPAAEPTLPAAERERAPATLADDLAFVETGPPVASAASGAPRTIFVWYADGGPPPSEAKNPSSGATTCKKGWIPGRFACTWGGAEGNPGCQRKIQAYLDRWYADFNVVFTLTKPATPPDYTVIVTSESAAGCGIAPGAYGVAPFSCSDLLGNTCYAFKCDSAQVCAHTIAQEHAHLVGLAHSSSNRDLLYPTAPCPTCDGFEDKVLSASPTTCGATQNSRALLLARFGAWSGGPKPDPFAGAGAGGGGGTAGAGSGGAGGAAGAGAGGAGAGGAGAGGAGGAAGAGAGGAGGAAGAGGAGGAAGAGAGGAGGAAGGAAGAGAGAAGGAASGAAGAGAGGAGGAAGAGGAGGAAGAGGAGGAAGAGGAGGAAGAGGAGAGGAGQPSDSTIQGGCAAAGPGKRPSPAALVALLLALGDALRRRPTRRR